MPTPRFATPVTGYFARAFSIGNQTFSCGDETLSVRSADHDPGQVVRATHARKGRLETRIWAEDEVNDTDARLLHPWLRINRVLRVMLHERWSAEAWPQVKAEFKKALALRSQIRRAGWSQLGS